MIIRELKESDVETLKEIYNYYIRTSAATFEHHELTTAQMHDRLYGPLMQGYPCIVAEENGRVEGYCALHPWRPRFEHTAEATLYLRPEATGAGLGREMTLRILDLAREVEWIHVVMACINAANTPSRKLVESLGFEQVAHYKEVGRKFGEWLDEVEYQKMCD